MLSWGIFYFKPQPWIAHASFLPDSFKDRVDLEGLSDNLRSHPIVAAWLAGLYPEGTVTTARKCLADERISHTEMAHKVHYDLMNALGFQHHACLLVLHRRSVFVTLSWFKNGDDFEPAEMRRMMDFAEELKTAVSIARTFDWRSQKLKRAHDVAIISSTMDGSIDYISPRATSILADALGVDDFKSVPIQFLKSLAWGTIRHEDTGDIFIADAEWQGVTYSAHMVRDGESLRIAIFEKSSLMCAEEPDITETESAILKFRGEGKSNDEIVEALKNTKLVACKIESGRTIETYLNRIKRKLFLRIRPDLDNWYRLIGSVYSRSSAISIRLTDCGRLE